MARAFGPQLASGFSGNLANLSDRDFGLAPGMTVKSACILIHNRIITLYQDHNQVAKSLY